MVKKPSDFISNSRLAKNNYVQQRNPVTMLWSHHQHFPAHPPASQVLHIRPWCWKVDFGSPTKSALNSWDGKAATMLLIHSILILTLLLIP